LLLTTKDFIKDDVAGEGNVISEDITQNLRLSQDLQGRINVIEPRQVFKMSLTLKYH
jgi:hypothetical protein